MINGASTLAKKHNVSDLAIGLTIVAFGTSAPELVVNSVASFEGHSNIALGNVIGSNNFNLFVILGIVGLIFPISVQSSTVWKEIPISLLAAIVMLLLANGFYFLEEHSLSRLDGLILLLLFFSFLYYVYRQMQSDSTSEGIPIAPTSNLKIWALIIVGLAGLVIGGKLVVDNAVEIATELGVSQKIIGLTILAAGTSLPELVTSVVAAFKKRSDMAIGNIVGSNIFNIFFILAISTLINPIDYDISFNTDLYLLIGGTIFLFTAMFLAGKKKLDRWEAVVLLITFIIYTAYLIRGEI